MLGARLGAAHMPVHHFHALGNARLKAAPDQRMIAWERGGGVWTLRTTGVDERRFLDAARTAAADPAALDGLIDQLLGVDVELVERWTAPARARTAEVELDLTSPDHHRIGLILTLPGHGFHVAGDSFVVPEHLAGQPLPVHRYEDIGWAGRFGGAWPGADVTVYRWAQDASAWIDDDQLRTFVASLRPATAGEWRAYLDTATGTVTPGLRAAETLDEVGREVPVATTTTTTD